MSTTNAFTNYRIHLAPPVRQARRTARPAGVLLATALAFWNCGGETDAQKQKAAAAAAPVPVVVAAVIQETVPIITEFTARTATQADYNDVVLSQKTSIDQATAAVSAGEAEVKNAELNLSYCTITSPIDGLIGQRMVSVGNLVGRGEPTLLATVSALDPLRVSFALSEAEYLTVARRIGESGRKPLPLDLILADGTVFPNKGLVTIASRAVDEKTGTLTLIAEFPNPRGLIRPGQFGRVRGVIDTVDNAILIPQVAVMEQQSAKIVYVVDDGNKVAVRTVVFGARYENMAIVKEGIKPGERVITEGMQKVRPGMVVTTEKPAATEK